MPIPATPTREYRVELSCYSGPLDLLLFLVRRHEIDLHDIPVAALTEQYFEHLRVIEQIDVQRASEFLVMAATLLEIKSAMLLPRPSDAADESAEGSDATAGLDPRYELVQQLLAYKRYKDAAGDLEQRRQRWASRYPNQPTPITRTADADEDAESAGAVEIDLEDANVLDLCEAFARVLETVGQGPDQHRVVYDDTPIALYAEDVLDLLRRQGATTLQDIFVGRGTRNEMIGLFLATLELVRQRSIRVTQSPDDGRISLDLRPEADASTNPEDEPPADWRDPQTGQMQYDWPDDASRRRAERRAQRQ